MRLVPSQLKGDRFRNGFLVISLDFEKYWGVRDKRSISDYFRNLINVSSVVERLLDLFAQHEIHATWSTVGALFLDSPDPFSRRPSADLPGYFDVNLCPYRYVRESDSLDPRLHFATDSLEKILASEGQEIGTHTFSHFYCREPGVSASSFHKDIESAIEVGARIGARPRTIVFPRNQVREDFLPILRQLGIMAFRGNQDSWIYRAAPDSSQTLVQRALRLLDSYVSLSGHNDFGPERCLKHGIVDIPASAFLRPYSERTSLFEPMRLRRILNGMRYSASARRGYHLWWHPHNFGCHLEENLEFLTMILKEFTQLRKGHGYESYNMGEVAERIRSLELLEQ